MEGKGLDKDGNDGLVQSTSSCCATHDVPNVHMVQTESYDDQEHEEKIEHNGDRPECNVELWYHRGDPVETIRSREPVEIQDTHRFTTGVSKRDDIGIRTVECVPKEARYIKNGKETAQ